MLDSINIGMTGLLGYAKGLKVIANNTANINTPGFKGASLQFADMFYSGSSLSGELGGIQVGHGLTTLGTTLSFRQGELRSTGKDLDLAIDGQGLFVLRDSSGVLTYTRDGQFKFDAEGRLTSTTTERQVMALDVAGNLQTIDLPEPNPATHALTGVTFDENGTMMLAYDDGQTIADKQLALARFDSIDAVTSLGGNLFAQRDPAPWHLGVAGKDAFGAVRSRTVEISNVDLSQEFSDLVIMQRGYQASSQIVTTANELLQELFAMKGRGG